MSRSAALAAVLLALGCSGAPDDKGGGVDSGPVGLQDADEDGYFDDEDCDDHSSAVHPGATELCDGIDNDCDGELDEGVTSPYYADQDGDGFGDPDDVTEACSRPSGTVPIPNDCDDSDPDSYPGAGERCDGADNDCDDSIDEGVTETFYVDADEDGYGDPDQTTEACEGASGAAAEGSDCDDADEDVHPGADELCNEVDDDCDGVVDDEPTVDTREWYPDVDGDEFGDDGAESIESCSQPAGYTAEGGDCDDRDEDTNPAAEEVCGDLEDDDCDGEADEGCPIEHCGTIADDETWAADDVHIVTCDVTVSGSRSPVLTIEDGVTVSFEPGTALSVGSAGYGTLLIDGSADGVVFTSSASSAAPGDWEGLTFGIYDEGSTVTGLEVAWAGDTDYGAVTAYRSSPLLSDLLVHDSASHGLYARSTGTPSIEGCTFEDNAGDGVHIETNGSLLSFSDNTLSGNEGFPVTLPAAYVALLDDSSSYTGNGDDRIQVYGDTVSSDADWSDIGVPLYVTGDIDVAGVSRPTLTMSDGLQLQMELGVLISVGDGNYGALVVRGTSDGVVFTSGQDDPAPGDWAGLYFGILDQGSDLSGVEVGYAGGDGDAAIVLYSADITLEDCAIHDSEAAGVEVGSTSLPSISGCDISDNGDEGVSIDTSSGLASGVSFEDNTLSGNGSFPLVLPAGVAGQIDASCALTGNAEDAVSVLGDTITADATWQALDVPWQIEDTVKVGYVGRPVLEIEPDAELRFSRGAGLYIGTSSAGGLQAVGTSSRPVVFTSAQDDPEAGDWLGVVLGDSCQSDDVRLSYVKVAYGGGNDLGNITFDACDGTLAHAEVTDSAAWCVYRSDADPTLTDVTTARCASGDTY